MKLTLKTKLVLSFVGVNLILGGVAFVSLKVLEKEHNQGVMQTAMTAAQSLGSAIEAQYYERYGDIQAFAMNPILRTGDKATVITYLNNYAALYGIYDLIMMVDKKGNLIAVNDKSPTGEALKVDKLYGQSFSDKPWFQSVIKGEFTESKEKNFLGTLVEQPYFDEMVETAYGKPMYGNSFSAPIKNDKGEVIGVITNRAGFRWVTSEFQYLFSKLKSQGLPSSELLLTDANGKIFYTFEPAINGGKEDLLYSADTLNKKNVGEQGHKFFESANTDKSGVMMESLTGGLNVMTGFSKLIGPKIVDSMNWTAAVNFQESEAYGVFRKVEYTVLGTLGLLCTLILLGSVWFANRTAKALNDVVLELRAGAGRVTSIARNVLELSTTISEGATEQAAAIQETASAIDEVSAMVKSNSENATQSKEVSSESRGAADQGQSSVTQVVGAMAEIDKSNEEIMLSIENSNRELNEIVKVIGEIGNKTKVINDIVFQTKLLSFNASVEAARAGEHGKGFAVVAEEVGNLAQMSGNAAKEISDMLDASIKKVEDTVGSSKSKVEKLIAQGKRKVQSGNDIAKEAGKSLDSILDSVTRLDQMVVSIATASNEQATGVAEINRAISQLDTVTQKNSEMAQKAAGVSSELKSQSDVLSHAVNDLLVIVNGKSETKDLSELAESNLHEAVQSQRSSNVVSFKEAREKTMKSQSSRPEPKVETLKVANGGEIPAADDARFEEI